MSTYQNIKAKALAYRKARDPLANFLTTVIAKADSLAKEENPGNPEVTDDHALRAINSFIKSANNLIDTIKDKPELPAYQKAIVEKNLLSSFLPAETPVEDVQKEISVFLKANEGADKKKLTGLLMKQLNAKFGSALNKKVASDLVKEALS